MKGFDKDKYVGYWIQRTSAALRAELKTQTRPLGFGVSEAMLILLLYQSGPSSLVELARLLEHSHPSVLRNIDQLERAGLLKRGIHPQDRRVKVLSLTQAGEAMVENVRKIIESINDKSTNGFTAEERNSLILYLKRITTNISDTDFFKHIDHCEKH